jgi:hypothetical protein
MTSAATAAVFTRKRGMNPASLASIAHSVIGMSLFAALFAATATARAQASIQDELTEDLISPSCRIGSLQSWQGQPCVVPMGISAIGGTE